MAAPMKIFLSPRILLKPCKSLMTSHTKHHTSCYLSGNDKIHKITYHTNVRMVANCQALQASNFGVLKSGTIKTLNALSSGQCVRRFATEQSELHQDCWKCGSEIDPKKDQYFCGCGLIQPPLDERNLFQVLGVEVDFDVDTVEVTRRYRELQTQLHPDKFSTKTQTEKDYSALQSANVNKAYATLMKPLNRALYMLEMHGLYLEEGDIQMDPEFLMEIMEINEDLANADRIEEVQEIKEGNEIILNALVSQISEAFRDDDLVNAKALICKLKYYANIDEKVKQIEMDNLA